MVIRTVKKPVSYTHLFAKAEKAAINRQLVQAKAYFEAGRSAITDVKEAEASDATAQAQEIAATQQLDIAREQLRVLTGSVYPCLLYTSRCV